MRQLLSPLDGTLDSIQWIAAGGKGVGLMTRTAGAFAVRGRRLISNDWIGSEAVM